MSRRVSLAARLVDWSCCDGEMDGKEEVAAGKSIDGEEIAEALDS